jgi:hypothetical protein
MTRIGKWRDIRAIVSNFESDDLMNRHLGPQDGGFDPAGPTRRPFTRYENKILKLHTARRRARLKRKGWL